MTEIKKEKAKKSKYADLITKIDKLTLLELNQLVKEIQEYFKIDLSLAVNSSQAPQTEKNAKKDEQDVVLTEIGESKIAVIKAVAKISGKSLLEAKKMLDNLPMTLATKKTEAEAEKLKKEMEDSGATVKLQ